jgi:hypothetical protein
MNIFKIDVKGKYKYNYQMTHQFWHTKPMNVSKKITKDEPCLIQTEHGFTVPELSPALKWDTVSFSNVDELQEVIYFLEKQYISKGYLFQIIYSKEHLLFEMGVDKYRVVVIRSTKNNEIMAMIGGSVRTIVYKQVHWKDVLFINFLCVQQKLRQLGLAPKLITEISRQAHEEWGVQRAYYISTTELPIPFSKTTYLHRILNIPACIQTNYWHPSKKEIDVWSRFIAMDKRHYRFEWIDKELTMEQYETIAQWINESNASSKEIYEYMTALRIQELCTSSCFKTYFVYIGLIPIGFLSFFYHPYRVLEQNTTLMTGMCYHYGVQKEYMCDIERIFTEWINDLRFYNCLDVFTTTDSTIADNTFVQGHSYYHYMYNVHMPEIHPRKIALIGL